MCGTRGEGTEGEVFAYYEVPSLEHQESSQRTLLAGGAVSVRVNGAVTDDGASSRPGGWFSLPVGTAMAGSSELVPDAIDKCVPLCDPTIYVCSRQQV